MNLTGKILIVDEDKTTLSFFDIVLSKLKFDVIKAYDGKEALEKIKLYNPDLMLIEDDIPKISGLEVIKKVRKSKDYKNYKHIPIIMFSSFNNPKDKVIGLESGVDDYITKPFNFSEVLARIRSILRHKELLNQVIKRERRLAILESLNTNLIAFTKHIKKPLMYLSEEISRIDIENENSIKKFKKVFDSNYKEMLAMLNCLEDEIIEIEKKGDNLKKEEMSFEILEDRIIKHLNSLEDS